MNEVLYEESAEPKNLKTQKAFYVVYSVFGWLTAIAAAFFLIFSFADFLSALPLIALLAISSFLFFFFGSDCFGRFFVFKRHNIVFVVFFGHFSDRVFFLFTHKNTPFDYFEQPDGVLYFLKREKLI